MYAYTSVMGTLERDLKVNDGLLLTWYEILIMLQQAPSNRLTHRALGEGVILSRSGVTRVVDRMVKEGLVEREPSSEDRRQSYVKMTSKGEKALDEAGPRHSRNAYDLFGKHLRPEEAPAVLAFLTRVMGDEENLRATRRVENEIERRSARGSGQAE